MAQPGAQGSAAKRPVRKRMSGTERREQLIASARLLRGREQRLNRGAGGEGDRVDVPGDDLLDHVSSPS